MRTHLDRCRASTRTGPDFVDVTDDVQRALSESGIRDGHVTVFSPHPSCAILVNELESGLLIDIARAMERVAADARHGAALIGSQSVVLPALGGTLYLGSWQRVILVELDGPASSREVVVQIVGE